MYWLRPESSLYLCSKVLVFAVRVLVALLSHSVVKGSGFWHSFCQTASATGNFSPQRLHGKSQLLRLWLFIIIFLSPALSFTSGRMHGGHNNPLLYVPAVGFGATYLHQSLTQTMNRRQLLSVVVVGWLARETLTWVSSKHATTFLKPGRSVCFTLNRHILKGALHRFYTSRWYVYHHFSQP